MNELPQPEMFDKNFDRKPDVPAMFQNAAEYRDFVLSLLFLKLSHAFNCRRNESGAEKRDKVKVRRDVAVAICELCWPNAAGWADQQLAEKVGEVAYHFKCGEFMVEDQALAEELCKLMERFDEEIEIVGVESEPSDN